MKMKCNKCGIEYSVPGGLLFGVPVNNKCAKYHLCPECTEELIFDEMKHG